jgi:hypothetical protein
VWRFYEQGTKALSGLALRLKIGPQSRASKAPKTKPGPTSYDDRMTLLDGEVVSRDATYLALAS